MQGRTKNQNGELKTKMENQKPKWRTKNQNGDTKNKNGEPRTKMENPAKTKISGEPKTKMENQKPKWRTKNQNEEPKTKISGEPKTKIKLNGQTELRVISLHVYCLVCIFGSGDVPAIK